MRNQYLFICSLLAVIFGAATAPAKTLDLDTARTVMITGEIGSSVINAASTIEKLSRTKGDIYLVLNSPGGGVEPGYIVINSMLMAQSRGVRFVCYVPQLAASMAFQILAMCDERYATKYAYLLWHPVRANVGRALTPDEAGYLRWDLRQIEKRMLAELFAKLHIKRTTFMYHYRNETLWTAVDVAAMDPEFITLVDSVEGFPINFSQFDFRSNATDRSKQMRNKSYRIEHVWRNQ